MFDFFKKKEKGIEIGSPVKGKTVAMVCSGDAGVYGMASLLYEMSEAHPGCELEVIPGITAANSGAAALGAAVEVIEDFVRLI